MIVLDENLELMLNLLRHAAFRTARLRMGKVIRASRSEILCYETGRPTPARLSWR